MLQSSEDVEKRLAELQTRQHALRQLVASAGWKELREIAAGAIMSRRQAAFSTMGAIKGLDSCFEIARSGAEVAGMQFVLALPQILLDDLEADIQRAYAERRETDNE